MFYYNFDMYYVILVLPAMLFAMWAQFNVQSTFKKYARVPSDRGMTGRDAARMILDRNGLYDVRIEQVSGELTDHYDPRENVIRLSSSTYASQSAAAVGVAAHEAGHAVQHAENYAPIRLRQAIIPISQFGSTLAMPLVLLGLVLGFYRLSYAGLILFATVTLFQLVTLPVEFNASSRALAALDSSGALSDDGLYSARRVLRAAALTYVAALFVSLANLLRLVFIVSGRDRRDR